ncbi:MAG: hypothetical protein II576_08485, partial [Prevotella sp.]|nr:hypothetical protein [Prevotella sp.]
MMYLIQVNILLVVFYGVYQLLFVRDTFFTWRRITLLLMGLMAVAIPMVDVGWWVSSHVENANLSEAYREMVLPTVTVMNTEGSFPWVRLLTILYICGVVVLFLRMMWQLLIIIRMATTHERRTI